VSVLEPSATDLAQATGRVATRLRQSTHAAVLTHERPDPDALGSQAALARMLAQLGAHVSVVNYEPIPRIYTFLQDALPDAGIAVVTADAAWPASAAFDTIVIVDTHAYQQLEPVAAALKRQASQIVAIDHHLSGDALAPLMLLDPSAAACAELLVPLASALGVRLDRPLAEALLAGIIADTGWFRFDSVRPRTLRAAAELLDAGATPATLYERLQQSETPPKLALMQRALASLVYTPDQRGAVMTLSSADFKDAGATQSQTEELVNLTLMVASVEVGALLTELPDGRARGSLRSKHVVDVNALAQRFSGGGHARAAGCRLDGPLDAARAQLLQAITEALGS
jgi:phosphoesterase RecJ-like protein